MSRRVALLLAPFLALAACGDDTPAKKQPEPGFVALKAMPLPGKPKSGVRAAIEDITGEIADDLNREFKMPRPVYITGQKCGEANAYYASDTHQIIICEEFAMMLETLFAGYEPQLRGEATEAAIVFFFLHEVSHALLGELGILDVGNQEDTADTIATYLLIEFGERDLALHAADSFSFMADWEEQSNIPFPYWDKHGLSRQRFYSVLCLLYGSDPAEYGVFVQDGIFPEAGAQQCVAQWTNDLAAIKKMLAPHRAAKR